MPKAAKRKRKQSSPNSLLVCKKEAVIMLERLSDSVIAEMTTHRSVLQPQQAYKMPKATKRKRKQSSPNSLLLCKKEAVILERLSDSVIAEMSAHRPALQSQQAIEENVEKSYFDSLPPEVIVKIFAYLSQNKLGQIARVCRKWSVLSRTSVLWQKVDVKFFLPSQSRNEVVINFLNMLPSCVICMSLHFIRPFGIFWFQWLEFEEICKMLKEKCPRLKKLVLREAELTSFSSLADLCTLFLRKVQILILSSCTWKMDHHLREINVETLGQHSRSNDDVSKIKILGLCNCNIHHFCKSDLLEMPDLEQLLVHDTHANYIWFMGTTSFLSQLHILDLRGSSIISRAFRIIRKFGHNLEKLYLCNTDQRDEDFDLNDQMLPHLKSICLLCCGVTCAGIISLIQTCHSLENVYVEQELVEEFRVHSFVADNRNKSDIVRSVAWNHNHV